MALSDHTPKIVEQKKLSDGAIAFRCRCCGDPSTDSWHTLYVVNDIEQAQLLSANPQNVGVPFVAPDASGAMDANLQHIQDELNKHKARVAARHFATTNMQELTKQFIEEE